MNTRCLRFEEDVVGLLEGTASESLREHVAQCDSCRDLRHVLEGVTKRVACAGDDFIVTNELLDHLAVVATTVGDRISETRIRAEGGGKGASRLRPSKRAIGLAVAAVLGIGASAAIGLRLADRERSPEAAATRAWHGRVTAVVRSAADKNGGLMLVAKSGATELASGAEIKAGMRLATDSRTRARIELDDGSVVVLDRATELVVADTPRSIRLETGAVLLDVAHVEGAPSARVETPIAPIAILGTKLTVTAAADRTNVEVLRGEVELAGKRVAAGQEGVVSKGGDVDVAPVNDLAQRAAFGEALATTHNEDAEAPASGLGELRARRPGKTDEKDHAVRLARHAVKIRVAGNVARTEIDEQFENDTNEELEGIYRFPLPPGAQIERLALEVDGHLLDGEFVDKAKAAAIWRGAIQNAAPKAPKPREEIVWVPGPWHDPALLEWQRGGRFELKIFPIPKRGSRRVVIAYTEVVAPVSGVRRYVYPLPQGASSKLTIGDFSVDAQVVGHDPKTPVRVRGYELEHSAEGSVERLATTVTGFTPSGDLAIEYSLDDRKTDASVFSFAGSPAPTSNAKEDKKGVDPIGDAPFVAIALRPKLPKWADAKPRDQVVVIDAGRAMFGERFARAKRLAVQMTQEMDRRDRVTILACDVTCRGVSGGFAAPGAPSAHDVDAFLTGIVPDGASDLVSAVRSAARLPTRDRTHDLRVVVLSDGVATAGYRSLARVATEVSDALDDPRAQVVAVPIGADADVTLLGEVARGGGGVVVPYQPGQRLETAALEVLNATYGTTLRDVEVVLPDGLADMAPASLPPLRAGSETILTARVRAQAVTGDLVLRGKVAGETFEARYPIEVKPTTDLGNAFVPRLFAAARIADRERQVEGDDRAELVALSRRFAVPSRHTSLLVLESEAMFRAFGIDRAEHAPQWTGEVAAQGKAVATRGTLDTADPYGADEVEEREKKKDSAGDDALGSLATGQGFGAGGGGRGRSGGASFAPKPLAAAPAPAPAATRAPARKAPAKLDDSALFDAPSAPRAETRAFEAPPPPVDVPRNRAPGRFMKRVFVRHATIHEGPAPAIAQTKVAQARAAVQAAPDERGKHKDLARVLALAGQLDELGEALERWSNRDPLDADVIVARADLAARRGDREGAMRILGGALAASAMSSQDAFVLATTVARGYERLGRAEACSFHIAAAELRPADPAAVARAIACERGEGRSAAESRWLAGFKTDAQRSAVTQSLAKTSTARAEKATGDIVVTASWTGGADLDLAIVDPSGRRAAAVTRLKGARAEGVDSRDHESLALATGEAGQFVVEIVRATQGPAVPLDGKITIRSFGQTQAIPFTLTGARAQVARLDVRWEAELVPLDGDGFSSVGPFDRGAAASALARVAIAPCAASGQVGTGHANVTFVPSGTVSSVVVDDANFAGTPAGRCVQTAFFSARVPAFSGAPVTIGKSFTLGSPMAR